MSDIRAERLTAARVHILVSDPSTIVLEMNGAADTHHFLMTAEELGILARRLTQDAAILAAKPVSPS